MRVEVEDEALREIHRRGVRAVTLRLVEEVREWTMCCCGDVYVVSPKVVVEEGARRGVRVEVDGVEVYVDEGVAEKARGVVRLLLKDGCFEVEGVELKASYSVKPYFKELPEWS